MRRVRMRAYSLPTASIMSLYGSTCPDLMSYSSWVSNARKFSFIWRASSSVIVTPCSAIIRSTVFVGDSARSLSFCYLTCYPRICYLFCYPACYLPVFLWSGNSFRKRSMFAFDASTSISSPARTSQPRAFVSLPSFGSRREVWQNLTGSSVTSGVTCYPNFKS